MNIYGEEQLLIENPERLLNNYCKNDDTISEGLSREINFSPLYE